MQNGDSLLFLNDFLAVGLFDQDKFRIKLLDFLVFFCDDLVKVFLFSLNLF